MSIDVIVPWHIGGDDTRRRAMEWTLRRWEQVHGMPARLAACPFGQTRWCKADAVNPAAAASTADVLVIADADSFVTPDALAGALFAALANGWAMPHAVTARLTRGATALLYGNPGADLRRLPLLRSAYPATPGGGIVIARRDVWDLVGGFDPRFVGWGGEDHALGMALTTLAGPADPARTGRLYHLWHTPAPGARHLSADTRTLDRRYRAAAGNPAAMAELIGER